MKRRSAILARPSSSGKEAALRWLAAAATALALLVAWLPGASPSQAMKALFQPITNAATNLPQTANSFSFAASTSNLQPLSTRAIAWGDYDNDGRIDLFMPGVDEATQSYASRLYHNTAAGFVDVGATVFAGVAPIQDAQNAAWVDFDNDGLLDLSVSGASFLYDEGHPRVAYTRLLRNNGAGFDEVATGFPATDGEMVWGDYDQDGRTDLLRIGYSTVLYRNTASGFVDVTTQLFRADALAPGDISAAAWGDYDNDGLLDLLLVIDSSSSTAMHSRLYHNTATSFVDVTSRAFSGGLLQVTFGNVAWADYDGDGWLDFVIAGAETNGPITTSPISRIYHNTGNGFQNSGYSIAGAEGGSVAWGDYDNDGRPDLLLTSIGSTRYALKLFHNTGAGFSDVTAAAVPDPNPNGAGGSVAAWVDYDNDARLDFLLLYPNQSGAKLSLYHNIGQLLNSSPSAPTGLSASVTSAATALTWNASSDAQTAIGGLSYNLRVGSSPGAADIVAPAALANGKRKLAVRGDIGAVRRTLLRGLKPGRTYYWSVQAIDDAFAGGPFAAEQSFTTPPFTASTMQLVGAENGAAAWGDYDGDGRLDLLVTGCVNLNCTGRAAALYHNTPGGMVDVTAAVIPGLPALSDGAAAWGDYDNDGRLDLVLAGRDSAGNPAGRLYHNNGASFSDATATAFPSADALDRSLAALAWGDYSGDGRLDLLVSGRDSTNAAVSTIYRNSGVGFVDSGIALPGIVNGVAAWGDYDNDGKTDLLLGGTNSASDLVTTLYHNNGGGLADSGVALTGVRNGSVAWGDYDADGKLDILLTGCSNSFCDGLTTSVYHNNGSGFDETWTGAAAPGVYLGAAAWGDYNNDGTLDFVLGGCTPGCLDAVFKLYRNTGAGFADDTAASMPGAIPASFRAMLGWADADGDGRLDLLVAGDSGAGAVTRLYLNGSAAHNTAPQPPELLFTSVTSATGASLSWINGNDDHTNPTALSYNLRVGTTPGGADVVGPMAVVSSGLRLLPALGNTGSSKSRVLSGLAPGQTYYWSVQSVDSAFAGSPFATEQSFTTPSFSDASNEVLGTGQADFAMGAVAWGDYNNDGRMDVLLTGYDGAAARSQLLRNTPAGFVDVTSSMFGAAGLPGLYFSAAAWGDYDNDGRLDLLVIGATSTGSVSLLYHNNGASFTDVSAIPGFFTAGYFPGADHGAVAWGDYDNDGRLDFLLTGDLHAFYTSRLYHNNGNGFDDVTDDSGFFPGNTLPGTYAGSAAWGDYDNDGRLDFLLSGDTGAGLLARLYHNNGNGFDDVTNNSGFFPGGALPGTVRGSVAWADYNNDGKLDFLLTGRDSANNLIARLYRNSGSGFVDSGVALDGVYYSAVAWGDYDNDGKTDLLITGQSNLGNTATLYHNNGGLQKAGNESLVGVYNGAAGWGDYDGDGHLDLLVTGLDDNGNSTRLYRNRGTRAASAPGAPGGLAATTNGGLVTLRWQAASDSQTPSNGLSYNLRIGTTPGGQDVLAPMSIFPPIVMGGTTSGERLFPARGPLQAISYTVSLTGNQTYYWSVQAVDSGFAGGVWAPEGSFSSTIQSTSTPTETATDTATPTGTSPATRTATATRMPTRTVTVTPTWTRTSTATVTPIWSRTATATGTATRVVTATSTLTRTATGTAASTATSTATGVSTATATPTATRTTTSTATRTATRTNTAVPSTATQTATRTETVAASTVTRTNTAVVNTATKTATATVTRTSTVITSTATRTVTTTNTAVVNTATGTATRTATRTALANTATASATRSNTALPSTATKTATSANTEAATTTRTATSTSTLTGTAPASRTTTKAATLTSTRTAILTATNTATLTTTHTATTVLTRTRTPIGTATSTATATRTPTAVGTSTSIRSTTATRTVTAASTATRTATALSTATVATTVTHIPSTTATRTAMHTATQAASSTATRVLTGTSTTTLTATRTARTTISSTASRTPTGANATATATRPATRTAPATVTQMNTATGTAPPVRTTVPTSTATASRTSGPASGSVSFRDVAPSDYFYVPVQYLVSREIVSGYNCGEGCAEFRPYNPTTRGQLSKIVVLAEGWTLDNPSVATFQDVPLGSTFFQYVETAVQHQIVGGYIQESQCGRLTVPCFKPNNNVTRGQLSKILVLAASWQLLDPATATFADVPKGSAFYAVVETASAHGIISGYDGVGGRQFRPGTNATRGQIAKIVYLALVNGYSKFVAAPAT